MEAKVILKREDGTQYELTAKLTLESFSDNFYYYVDCFYRAKGKKKWIGLPDTIYDYQYRALSMEKRREYRLQNMLNFVTKEEVLDLKIKLWEKLKPTL